MKKLAALLCLLALCIFTAVPVMAAGELVVDNADILTDAEEASLNAQLSALKNKYNMDYVVVTTPSTDGKSWREYADDYYDQNGYSSDGILMLVSMEEGNRGFIFSTCGNGIQAFTDYGLNEMEDNVYSYLAQGNYAGACSQYASDCDWITQRYVDGNPYDYYGVDPGYKPSFRPISIVIAIIVGALIALIVVSAMKGKHRSVIAKSEATSYMVPGSLNITGSRDTFLYHNVVAAPIPQNNGPRSGGGGGGSSTHVSSGGVSHGGSGGRGF